MRDVGSMHTNGYSKRAIQEEAKKCDLVCANCHKDRTYRRRVAQ